MSVAPRRSGLRKTLAAVFGTVAAVGLLFLGVGLLLSGEWRAERAVHIEAGPDLVFPYLDSLALWDEWTVWGDIESQLTGPARGAGATRSWDNDAYGQGTFTLVESSEAGGVRYRVDLEPGSATIAGQFDLVARDGGTTVTWVEAGDFGNNPLLGYVARTMERSQGAELERSLDRLKAVVEGGS